MTITSFFYFLTNRILSSLQFNPQQLTHRLHDFLHVAFRLLVALCALEDSALFLSLHVTEHHWPVLSPQLFCRPQVDCASTTFLYRGISLQSPTVEMLGWKVTDRLVLHRKTIFRINEHGHKKNYFPNVSSNCIYKNYNNQLV